MINNLIISIMILFLAGCGTETGNPVYGNASNSEDTFSDGGSTGTITTTTTNVSEIIDGVCYKFFTCRIKTNSCASMLYMQTNIDTEIGLLENSYVNLKELYERELGQTVAIDQNQLKTCKEDIGKLSCDSSEVKNAYDVTMVNPYELVAEMLPPSCASVYQGAESAP